MKSRIGVRAFIPLAILTCLSACRPYPTKPVTWQSDHAPVIASMSAFPEVIGQGDSMLVTVAATDVDGDTLWYHWYTDSRLVMKPYPGPWDPYYRPNAA